MSSPFLVTLRFQRLWDSSLLPDVHRHHVHSSPSRINSNFPRPITVAHTRILGVIPDPLRLYHVYSYLPHKEPKRWPSLRDPSMGRCPQNKTCRDAERSPPHCPCREFSVFVAAFLFLPSAAGAGCKCSRNILGGKTKLANLLAANLVFSVGRMGSGFWGPNMSSQQCPSGDSCPLLSFTASSSCQ